MKNLRRKVSQSANIHGKIFILFLFEIKILKFFLSRYICYPGFKNHGKQMAPGNVIDLLCFFYRGSDVMTKLTCAQGSFYEGSGFRNWIEGKRPSELEV